MFITNNKKENSKINLNKILKSLLKGGAYDNYCLDIKEQEKILLNLLDYKKPKNTSLNSFNSMDNNYFKLSKSLKSLKSLKSDNVVDCVDNTSKSHPAINSLISYSANAYKNVNKILKKEILLSNLNSYTSRYSGEEIHNIIENIQNLFFDEKLPYFNKFKILYRGKHYNNEEKLNNFISKKTIIELGFLSTSTDLNIAYAFADKIDFADFYKENLKQNGVIMILLFDGETFKNKIKILPINELSANPYESEVLLPNNTKFVYLEMFGDFILDDNNNDDNDKTNNADKINPIDIKKIVRLYYYIPNDFSNDEQKIENILKFKYKEIKSLLVDEIEKLKEQETKIYAESKREFVLNENGSLSKTKNLTIFDKERISILNKEQKIFEYFINKVDEIKNVK